MKRSDGARQSSTVGLSISPRTELRSGVKNLWRAILDKRVAVELDGQGRTERKGGRRRLGMDITWLTDRIAVGGGIWNAENMAEVSRAGITHIIDMQIEFDDTALAKAHGIKVCWNPVDDDFMPKSREVFERGVEFGLGAIEEDGAKLYVHCAAGVHRAPMMALALLAAMGWEMEDGMELIERRRPVADFADVYVRSVKEFLRGR